MTKIGGQGEWFTKRNTNVTGNHISQQTAWLGGLEKHGCAHFVAA